MSVAASARSDRGLSLALVVAALASLGALLGPLTASCGARAPTACASASLDGARLVCGSAGGEELNASPRAWLLGQKLDLNLATAADLARIPGIGRGLARAIVAEREQLGGFRALEDIDAVRGVGPAKLRLLARYVEVPAAPAGQRDANSESRPVTTVP